MAGSNVVLGYVNACASGKLPLSDCGPVWQLGVIGILLAAALLSLVVLRMYLRVSSAQGR